MIIYFLESEICKKNTGFEYIFNAYLKAENLSKKIITIRSKLDLSLGSYGILGLPFVLSNAYLLLLYKNLFKINVNEEKSIIIGSSNNLYVIYSIIFKINNYYMVDSLYDYYSKKLKNKLIKKIILSLIFYLELYISQNINGLIFLNSRISTRKFNFRYRKFSKAKKARCLPIGLSISNFHKGVQNEKFTPIKDIGIYANFGFYENFEGIKKILDFFKDYKKKVNIHIAGPGSKQFDCIKVSNYVKLISYGYVEDLGCWMDALDCQILPAIESNGVKIKLLELIYYNKPVFVLNEVYKHLLPAKSKIFANVYNADGFDELNLFLDKNNYISSINNIDILSWDNHIKILNESLR